MQRFCVAVSNALKNLFRKKSRTMLTVLSITIGVASVVIISMIGATGRQTIASELRSMGIGGVMVRTESQSKEKSFDDDALELLKNQPQVISATPLLTDYSSVKAKSQLLNCVVWGIDQDTSSILSLEIIHGRRITRSDIAGLGQVCLVDESYAQKLYQRSNIVGKTVQIKLGGKYEEFEVVGIVRSGGSLMQGLMGEVVPCFTYIPYTTMQTLSTKSGFSQMVAQTNQGADLSLLEQNLSAEMDEIDGPSIKLEDLNQQMEQLNQILSTVTLVLAAIAAISLVVAGLSIMTVMLVSVSERTREIGIKKSIGAHGSIILLEFLTEAFLVTLLGVILGIALGLMIGWTGCWWYGFSPSIDWQMIAMAVLFSFGSSLIFSAIPAQKAARLKPVDALSFSG